MKQIGVFGASGMLGAYVESYFKQQEYQVEVFGRADVISDGDKLKDRLASKLNPGAWVINCVGVIKPQVAVQGEAETIRVNSLFPHILSAATSALKINLLHITTDCVFSGKEGSYKESSAHDEIDIYGRTKSLGEPKDCMVIRTSIIGEEKTNARSLIEWAKSQAGKDVKGFLNHTWNGVTCLQFAKVAQALIEKGISWKGVRHVYSPSAVNKFELLSLIDEAFDLKLKIASFEPPTACYRTLATEFPDIIQAANVPELKVQLAELKKYTWA